MGSSQLGRLVLALDGPFADRDQGLFHRIGHDRLLGFRAPLATQRRRNLSCIKAARAALRQC